MHSRLACLIASLSAIAGCHSAGKSTSRLDGGGGSGGASASGGTAAGGTSGGAAAGATGGTGGTAAGGTSGTGGIAAGGTSGTGGAAAGGTGGTGASDGAVGMTATEVCRAAIRAQAERLVVCIGDSLEDRLRVANACPDYYFNPDSNRTVADIAACVGPLAARTCTEVVLFLFPSCLTAGKRPAGAGCAYSSQCESGSCGSGGSCSTCRATGAPLGGDCRANGCQNGSFCHPGTSICTDPRTIVYAKEGQACDLAATPVVGCEGDLYCRLPTYFSTAGVCTAAPGAGQACGIGRFTEMICAAGTTCTSAEGGTCVRPGDCGGNLQCDAASFCKTAGTGLTCAPRATVGQACDPADLLPCVSPAICAWQKCVVPRASGETCDENNPCDGALLCVAGSCQPLGSANCPAGGDGGAR